MGFQTTFETMSADTLRGYIEDQREENLHLEFKTIASAHLTSTDDKKNLAAALSGFANSSGGLIVWGVVCRKNSEGIDCAHELREIPEVQRLVSRLNELTGDGVSPTVSGVQHRGIQVKDGSGFAVTLIPESDAGPHMAKLGEDRYYKRSGDSFYKMEHFDVADMFAKRRKPRLSVVTRVVTKGIGASVTLGLCNEGRASAKSVYFAFNCTRPFVRGHYGLDGNANDGMNRAPRTSTEFQWFYEGGADWVLHPGVTREVTLLSIPNPHAAQLSEALTISYVFACDDQAVVNGKVEVPLDDLL